MIGDNWPWVMYDGVRGTQFVYTLYFIAQIILGNIIMLNLFLAILLGNFERARDFGVKKKILEMFIDLQSHGFDLSQSIDAILVDLADYVKISVLEWPKRIVDQEKIQEDKTIRLMMISNAEFMDDMNLILGSYLSLTSAVRDEDNKFCMLRSNLTVYLDS